MRITLIKPPTYTVGLMGAQLVPFLGIVYIAAAARERGHEVDVVDMCSEDIERTEIVRDNFIAYGMSFSALKKRLKPSEVFGFTCAFSQDWVFNRQLIQYVKKLYPESTIVAGGEHISALPEYCLEDCPQLDIGIMGEGEEVFVRLLDIIEKRGSLSDMPSLIYRLEEAKGYGYARTSRGSRIKEIDKIPQPAWELIPLENYLAREMNYHIKRGRTIPMLASRGCPYKCSFCSNSNMWGNPWIARNPKLVVDEMEYYINRYQVKNFVFSDLAAVIDRDSIINLSKEIINRQLNITWQLPTLRTEVIDYHILRLMYQAGCRDLDFALESASRHVLRSVNKQLDVDRIVPLINNILKARMNLSINIILGLPEEKMQDFLKTYALIIKLALMGLQELNPFPFVLYPGSRLFTEFLRDKKITLQDSYFLSLFGYANITQGVSWSERFAPRTLSLMRLFLLLSFYSLMFIAHPQRILQLMINFLRGRTTTKFEGVMQRIFKNIKVYFRCRNLEIGH